jgi:RRXRR protein
MRTPVVARHGVPLMPCHPAQARRLLAQGKAHGRWNKRGLFYIQLTWEQEPNNQPLAIGVDPGATYEGCAVVGPRDTVLNLMAEALTLVSKAQPKTGLKPLQRGAPPTAKAGGFPRLKVSSL